MREFRSYGSVRGVLGNQHSYRDQLTLCKSAESQAEYGLES